MKKFVLNIILFAIILVGISFLIGSVELSDEYVIYKTGNTSYEKIAWDLETINKRPGSITGSNIILGPSLIQSGVCDSVLTAANIPAINLGVNGGGNEMQLYLLKRILELKPKRVFLHKHKNAMINHHNMAPLVYSSVAILKDGQTINFAYIHFIFKRLGYTLDYFFSKLVRDGKKYSTTNPYGVRYEEVGYTNESYNSLDQNEMQDSFESINIDKKNYTKLSEKNRSGLYFSLIKARRWLLNKLYNSDWINNSQTQQRFLTNACKLGNEKNIETYELYLPLVTDVKTQKVFNPDFYRENDDCKVVSIHDISRFNEAECWFDRTHLSKKGAILFTQALVQEKIITP